MATEKSAQPSTDMNQLVTRKLFRDNEKYTDDVFVGWNGRPYIIKRGIEVQVPLGVALILDRSEEQKEFAAMNSEKLQSEFEAASRSYGIGI